MKENVEEVSNSSFLTTKNVKPCLEENSNSNSVYIDKETPTFDLYKGLLFMFCSCAFKSVFSVSSKLLMESDKELTSFFILLAKTYVMIVISVIVTIITYYVSPSKLTPEKADLAKVILRSVLSVCSISITVFSIATVSMSDVFAIYYCYPCIVLVICVVYFREKAGILDYLCLTTCFLGVLLVIRPTFINDAFFHYEDNHQVKSQGPLSYLAPSKGFVLTLMIGAAFIKAIEDITIKRIGRGVDPIIFPIIYSFVGIMIYPLPLMYFGLSIKHFVTLSLYSWMLIIVVALMSFSMQYFLAKAIQNESASRVSMVNYIQLVFMLLSDIFIFHKDLHFIDIIGVSLIFFFNFANGLYKLNSRLSKKEDLLRKSD